MNHLISSCPIAARRRHTFVEYVQLGGDRRRMDFEKDIVWLQKAEATSKYMHGGEELKDRGTYVDSPHYLSCIEPAIHRVDQGIKTYSIDKSSTLSLVIEAKIELVPVIEAEEDRIFNQSRLPDEYKKWVYPHFDWRGMTRRDIASAGTDAFHRRLGPIELCKQIVWSSQWDDEQNAAVMAQFKLDWAVGVSGAQLDAALENAPGLAFEAAGFAAQEQSNALELQS